MQKTFIGKFDFGKLQQELIAALGGADNWYISGGPTQVTFTSTIDYPVLISPEVLAQEAIPGTPEVEANPDADPPVEFQAAVPEVPAVEYKAAVYGVDPETVINAHTANAKSRDQDKVWDLIQDKRTVVQYGGVKVKVNDTDEKWFHTDAASRTQQLGLVMLGANIPAGLWWKTMDGTFVTMTPELAQKVFVSVATSEQQVFAIAEQHKAAMLLVEDPLTYDYSTGWPAVYESV